MQDLILRAVLPPPKGVTFGSADLRSAQRFHELGGTGILCIDANRTPFIKRAIEKIVLF